MGSAPRDTSKLDHTFPVPVSLISVGGHERGTRVDSDVGSAMDPIELEEVPPDSNGHTEDDDSSDMEYQTDTKASKSTNILDHDVKALDRYTEIPDTYASPGPSKEDGLPHRLGNGRQDWHEPPATANPPNSEFARNESARGKDPRVQHRAPSDTHNKEATGSMSGNDKTHMDPAREYRVTAVGPNQPSPAIDQHRSLLDQKQELKSPAPGMMHTSVQPSCEDSSSMPPEAEPAKECTTEDESQPGNHGDTSFVDPVPVQEDLSMAITGGGNWPPKSVASSFSPSWSPYVPRCPAQTGALRFSTSPQPRITAPRSWLSDLNWQVARAPSPSDAALARNAASMQAGCHNTFIYDDHMHGYPSRPPPLNRPSAIADYQSFTAQGHHLAGPPPPWYDKAFDHHRRGDPLTAEPIAGQAWNVWSSDQVKGHHAEQAESNRYEQGPFSMTWGDSDYHFTHCQSYSPPPPKSCLVRLKVDSQNVHGQNDVMQQTQDSAKSSKVDISNLVNPHADGARSLKRKSGQISSEEMVSSSADRVSQHSSGQAPMDDDFGPHAQVPDPAVIVHDTMSQGLASDLSQVSTRAVIGADAVEEGPVRKRIKMSTPKAGSIGKVVSGICLGLAGAFAALVATTPADVWNEALRETVKLT